MPINRVALRHLIRKRILTASKMSSVLSQYYGELGVHPNLLSVEKVNSFPRVGGPEVLAVTKANSSRNLKSEI